MANQEPVFQIPRFLIVFFNSDIFSRVLTFCVQVLLLISINIMVPYKSDFTKNNYDLFIKGPAVLLSRDYTIHLSRVCTIHGRDVLKFSDICKIFPEFLWVIKYSCIELSSSLIFISLVFFLILTFLISDESGQTPTRQKSSSLSGQFKSFKNSTNANHKSFWIILLYCCININKQSYPNQEFDGKGESGSMNRLDSWTVSKGCSASQIDIISIP